MVDKNFIGYQSPSFEVEVEKGRLRLFAKALGEQNPIYYDEAAAEAGGHPSLPVMPTFFFCLEMEQTDPYAWFKVLGIPLSNALHAEQAFDYHRMAYAGDTLRFEAEVADIYTKKDGALEFVVQDNQVSNQHRERVASFRRTLVIQAR